VASRGVLVVVLVALGLGGGALALHRLGPRRVKLPGPCEVTRVVPELEGLPPERHVHYYDARGHEVLALRMLGHHVSESTRWERDEAGRVVLEERLTPGPIYSTEADGTQRVLDHAIVRTRFTYDAQGRMLTRTYAREDGPSTPAGAARPAPLPHVTTYRYDAAGRLVDAHAEWEGKYASSTVYEHDAGGRLVAEHSDGSARGRKTYEHDAEGRVIREVDDALSDGIIDHAIERRYDEDGRVVLERETQLMDTRETEYAYDAAGNVLTRRERAVEPGTGATVIDTYDYGCWRLDDGRPVDDRPLPPP
jgi:YD repeat-containing protein